MTEKGKLLNLGWRERLAQPIRFLHEEDGALPLERAMWGFDICTREQRFRFLMALIKPELSEAEFSAFLTDESDLAAALVRELVADKLVARGFLTGEMRATAIPAEWWADVTIDPFRNTATGSGSTFYNLVIRPKQEGTKSSSATNEERAELAKVWLTQRSQADVDAGRGVPLKKTIISELCEAFRWADRSPHAEKGYQRLPAHLKGKHGPRRKPADSTR